MLSCPSCGATINARSDMLGIAACGQCGGLFEWPTLPEFAPSINRPRRVKVEFRDGTVHAIRWRSNPIRSLAAGALLVVLVGVVSPCLVVLFVPLWQSVRRFGGIRIELGPVISIRSGMSRRRRFAATTIRQPFVVRKRGGSYPWYDLCATQADGTVVTLAEGFPSPVEAQYVEHELEAALGIEDAEVPGEHDRRALIAVDVTAPLRALRISCPACAAVLNASDLQLSKGQAVCKGCGKGMLLGGPGATGSRAVVILPPSRVLVDRTEGTFALETRLGDRERSVIGRTLLRRTFFSAIFAGVVAGFPYIVNWVVGSMLTVLWVSMVWLAAAQVWNRVRIRVDNELLHVRLGPIPTGLARTIRITEIAQVFVRAQPRTFFTLGFSAEAANEGYQLCVVDHRGAVLPLVGRMMDLREARDLEEQLEQYLGIHDAPVVGEVEGKMLGHQAGTPSLPGSGNLSLPDATAGGGLSVPRAAGALSEPD
jgi:hypothetical protein